MNCHDVNAKLADLLFEETPGTLIAKECDIHAHLAQCQGCSGQLAELRATMALMDAWEAPEPNPYFLTRLHARLDEEREAVPANWYERLRARLVYGSRLGLRPVAAMALSVMVLLGGGAYLGFNFSEAPVVAPPQRAAVVGDLQTMDNNAQLLDQLEALSTQNND